MKHTPLILLILLVGCGPGGSNTTPTGTTVDGATVAYAVRRSELTAVGPVVDNSYALVSPEWVKANIGMQSVSGDCDDFSRAAWMKAAGMRPRPAFGMLTRSGLSGDVGFSGHAFNFFVDPQTNIWFFEPQNGKAWKPTDEEAWVTGYYWL